MANLTESGVWDQRYAEPGVAFGTEPNKFLVSQTGLFRAGASVLTLGEGEGRNALWLAQLGLSVTAVDLSEIALSRLAARAAELRLPVITIQANLADWELGRARWDAIVSIWCHLPSAVRRSVHKQVMSGLKSGGVFVLEAYTPRQIALKTGGPSDADLLPTAADLRRELEDLRIERCEELQRPVSEGTLHNGVSEVVQYVGRKPAG